MQTGNELKEEVIFISDLHLSLEKKFITRRFIDFLEDRAKKAQALYILGDLFDAWIGDDDYTPPNKTVRSKLSELTATGTRVYVQPGNRDFLLGSRFAQQSGVELLGDYHVIDLFGVKTLLTHGDLLCTDDIAYQQFRLKSRSPDWQQGVLAKPLWLRLFAARWYRLRSHFHKRGKTDDIMDVNQQTVVDVMKQYGCDRLIHGHTHRPAMHEFLLDDKPVQRFVLADWRPDKIEMLCWSRQGMSWERLV